MIYTLSDAEGLLRGFFEYVSDAFISNEKKKVIYLKYYKIIKQAFYSLQNNMISGDDFNKIVRTITPSLVAELIVTLQGLKFGEQKKNDTLWLNRDTFDVSSNFKDGFEVDEKIAKTISLLNKKGYKILYSCSGHLPTDRDDAVIKLNYNKLEHFMIHGNLKDINIYDYDTSNDCYVVGVKRPATSCYVMFDSGVNLPIIPDGFSFNQDKVLEYKVIFNKAFILEHGRDETLKEIKDANFWLEKWAKSLPINTM